MSQPNVKKNFLLSTLYQILTMITPFITTPYVSRVLGPSGIGVYSYTYSIEMYFSMFAALGTISYGAREIARNRNDKSYRSQLFWEIEILTIITTGACIILWAVWIMLNAQYRIYYLILTFYLLATMADISWFYTGIEQFKYIVTQNTIFKLLSVVAIFVFVKDKNDVAIYVAIMSLAMLLGNISMWVYLPKFIGRVSIKGIRILPHFKETLIYFIPTIATSIYTVLDKTLIGVITRDANQNGYYEQATKIINICKALTFTALNNVMGARISFLYAENKFDEIKERILKSIDYILFMGIGICFGLISVSSEFVPLFFGAGYNEVIILLQLLSPLVIIIGISNCLGSQYYTPAGLRKQSAQYIIIGSVVNFILNMVLIPFYKSRGAVIATLVAEAVIAILYILKCEKIITVKNLIKYAWKKIIAAVIMVMIIYFIDHIGDSSIAVLILEIMVGTLVYISILYLFKDSFVYKTCAGIVKDKIGWFQKNRRKKGEQ